MGTTVPPLNDMKIDRRTAIKTAAVGVGSLAITPEFLRAKDGAELFGEGFANLEMLTTGEWWKRPGNNGKPAPRGRKGAPPSMNVPRDEVVAFAMYTHCLLYTSPSPRDS